MLSNENIWLTQKRLRHGVRQQAEQKTLAEYEKFNTQQRIESDFDRDVKKLLQKRDAQE
ncbi:hypothetical protein [Pseudomonas hefeiensis]|uniref:Uncharacterized protein n=1 Tax=Pseudomonas hefeiensis TaxID=2738125 RepID=A0ABY9GCZ7_9PSED|nr:hypothetical protein [Pseudomonas sp. FP205]WLH13515.1 hypothetical protein PSH57_03900 [Pseudomonas sp. FP205]